MTARSVGAIAAIALSSLAFILLFPRMSLPGRADPDRSYHIGLSRETVKRGQLYPHSIPQVKGLGWDRDFQEKEFLFHVLTTLGYRVDGAAGVEALAPALSAIVLALLVLIGARWLPVWGSASIVATVALSDPRFSMRLAMVRPHVLALVFFAGFLASLVWRRRWGAIACCFLFGLSYHTYYIPALVAVGYALLIGRSEPRRWVGLAHQCLALVASIVVNPFFPANIIMSVRHARIALFEIGQGQLEFGSELLPMASPDLLALYGPILGALVGGLLLLAYRKGLAEVLRPAPDLAWLAAGSAFFLALAAKNPRAIEFAIPMVIATLACVISLIPRTRARRGFATAAIAAVLLGRTSMTLAFYRGPPPQSPYEDLKKGLLKVADRDASVFNCEWETTPFILDARPDYAFLDILDPSFLYAHDPDLHRQREAFRAGLVGDPYALIVASAGSDHVLCRSPGAVAQLERDPHFYRRFQTDVSSFYALAPARDPRFADSFAAVRLGSLDIKAPTAVGRLAPTPDLLWKRVDPPSVGEGERKVKSVYLDLRRYAPDAERETAATQITCYAVRPSADQAAKQVGRTLIGVGGGRNVRLWLNGQPLYASQAGLPGPHLIAELVRLDHPLGREDRLEAVVCSQATSPFLGFALSFWTPEDVADVCRKKGYAAPIALEDRRDWQRFGGLESSCLGPIARSR